MRLFYLISALIILTSMSNCSLDVAENSYQHHYSGYAILNRDNQWVTPHGNSTIPFREQMVSQGNFNEFPAYEDHNLGYPINQGETLKNIYLSGNVSLQVPYDVKVWIALRQKLTNGGFIPPTYNTVVVDSSLYWLSSLNQYPPIPDEYYRGTIELNYTAPFTGELLFFYRTEIDSNEFFNSCRLMLNQTIEIVSN